MGVNHGENLEVLDISKMDDLTIATQMDVHGEDDTQSYDFYNSYGGRVGFSIRKEYAHKSKIGEITSRTFVCSKEGLRKYDKRDFAVRIPREKTRTGCGALMSIKLIRQIGKYRVINFVETHNHPLVVSAIAHMLPSQRKISTSQYIEIDLADDCGIPLRSSYELMGREAGGRECVGFLKKDQENYLRTKRQRMLEFGEAWSILKYFQDQTVQNPSFFHSVQLATEEQITNIFWADARMIIDYGQFGDVVTFDTTYKINRESRPFAIFVGFNNHRETIVFGAALIGLGGVRSVLGKFIDEYEEEEEFFAAWNAMLDEFDVYDNSWLQSIFHLRKKWVRAYVR
ncbi:protein FAR1-RELATED SEQUENCE 5-like [Camellia sinensis]|uniref:protein FAR1-RELATED SEQUENCE 5-like n=1 Tax=Camellia sinensis TaxID=4442 RepID=UPI001035B05E|nr:protein FAR1-RELATED SEQUENCE 5-like [Camellia sinensis]